MNKLNLEEDPVCLFWKENDIEIFVYLNSIFYKQRTLLVIEA